MTPFDAVLLISFGGPQGIDDIRPFLANVLRGRNVPAPESTRSRITTSCSAACRRSPRSRSEQADGLRRTSGGGRSCRCRSTSACATGIRFSPTRWRDVARRRSPRDWLHHGGAGELFELPAVSRERRASARRRCAPRVSADIEMTYAPGWHAHEGFIAANAAHVREALDAPAGSTSARTRALIFTAHSIPHADGGASRYREQLPSRRARWPRGRASPIGRWSIRAAAAARRIRGSDRTSATTCARRRTEGVRGGGPVPDRVRLRSHRGALRPRSRSRRRRAARSGCLVTRAAAVNDDPLFLDMMADVVLATVRRMHAAGR